jgi:hypothetical protein
LNCVDEQVKGADIIAPHGFASHMRTARQCSFLKKFAIDPNARQSLPFQGGEG